MSLLGALVTGAGVQTSFTGQSQLEQFYLIGDVDTTNPLQAFQVEVGGQAFITIPSAALVTAFMKWQMQDAGTVVGLLFKTGTGKVPVTTNVRFTNAGATTPNIYAFSAQDNGVPFSVAPVSVNSSSYLDFDKFSALFIETPANVADVEITFSDGSRATMTPVEVDALFSLQNQSESNGRLGTVSVIDNRDQKIQRVRVNTNSSGACVVLKIKVPDAAWRVLNGKG